MRCRPIDKNPLFIILIDDIINTHNNLGVFMKILQKFALIALCTTQLTHTLTLKFHYNFDIANLVSYVPLSFAIFQLLKPIPFAGKSEHQIRLMINPIPRSFPNDAVVGYQETRRVFIEKNVKEMQQTRTSATKQKPLYIGFIFSYLLLRKPLINLIHKAFPQKQSTNIENTQSSQQ